MDVASDFVSWGSKSWVQRSSVSGKAPTGRLVGQFGDLPSEGTDAAVLSTGSSVSFFEPNLEGNFSASNGLSIRGVNDPVILKVDFDVRNGGNCVAFDFRFYSEEFPEFVGSEFNDAFLAELDANTWSIDATNFSNPVVAPANFAFVPGPTPVPIEVNTAGPAAMTAENAAGTTYDGATRLLTAQKAVSPGQHSLYFTIFDQGDGGF